MALAIVGYFWVQSLPRRVMIFTLPASSRPCMRYPSNLISCSQSGPSGAFFTSAASCGLTQVGRDVRSTPRVIVARSDFGITNVYQSQPPPVGTEAPGRRDIKAPSTCGGVHRDGRGESDGGIVECIEKAKATTDQELIGDYIAEALGALQIDNTQDDASTCWGAQLSMRSRMTRSIQQVYSRSGQP